MSSLDSTRFLVRLLSIAFSLGAAFSSGMMYGLHQDKSVVNHQKTITQPESRHFGLAEYERLETKMTVAEVEAVLGRGKEIKRSETTATFIWKNPDESKITALFEKGRLKDKEQSDL